MITIIGGRKSGRTSHLINLTYEKMQRGELCYMVVHSQAEAYRVHQKSIELGTPIPFPLTYDEFLNQEYSDKNIRWIVIDNTEKLLGTISKVPIYALSVLLGGLDEL